MVLERSSSSVAWRGSREGRLNRLDHPEDVSQSPNLGSVKLAV